MSHEPTPEQRATIQATQASEISLMVTAYAGCAKTTTLEMLSRVLPQRPTLALAFNVKIKKELERRLPGHFTVLTLNGLGHRAWARVIGGQPQLDDKKLGKIVTIEFKKAGMNGLDDWGIVKDLVSKAMQLGITPKDTRKGWLEDTEDQWQEMAAGMWLEVTPAQIEVARRVLRANVMASHEGIISFDDQLYMPIFFGRPGAFPQFAIGLIDESQDLSSINHEQVRQAIPAPGRLIVVGDPKQAVYQFRGADGQSMHTMKALRPHWIELPLATTFRCPQVIVQRQQEHAPGFRAGPGAPEGHYTRLPKTHTEGTMTGRLYPDGTASDVLTQTREVGADSPWSWAEVMALTRPQDEMAILCRNNAPLLSMAFKLIRGGTSCQMLGRDIGKGLIGLAKKLAPEDSTNAGEVRDVIEDWRMQERSRALANDDDQKVAGIEDRAECLLAVLDSGGVQNAGQLRTKLESLFGATGRVTLATGHRSKGLEWDVVLHLDSWRIPSKYARKNPSQMEQEKNLRYVIETRAKRVLIEADLERFEP